MSQQRQKVIDFLKRLSVPIGIIVLFGVFTIFYFKVKQYREEEKHRIEEENLKGICEKTGTNLYEELGAEGFFNLAQKQRLAMRKEQMKDHINRYKYECKKEQCGLYILSRNGDGFNEFIQEYQQQFRKTAFEEEGKLANYPLKVVLGMVKEKMNLDTPVTDLQEGIFLSRFHYLGEIYVISKYKQGELYTLVEMKENGLEIGISPASLYESRRKGYDNFFVRTIVFIPSSVKQVEGNVMEDVIDGMIDVSNCGDIKEVHIEPSDILF